MLDFAFIRDNWLYIVLGLRDTLGITLISLFIAIPLAVLVAKGRRSTSTLFRVLSAFYVSLVDGIPLLIQIPLVFLALPQVGIVFSGLEGAVFILTLYYTVPLSDLFTTHAAASGNIRLADLRSLAPEIAGTYVALIKDSTLVSLSGFIHDVYWRAQQVGRLQFKYLEALLVAAVIYLIVNTVISYSFRVRRLARAE
jgi:polar amino acid transport system permease protein